MGHGPTFTISFSAPRPWFYLLFGYTFDAKKISPSTSYREIERNGFFVVLFEVCRNSGTVHTDLDIAVAVQDDVFQLEISVDYAAL